MGSGTKVIQSVLLYGGIPLLVAAWTNKLTITVALDLVVWLLTVMGFFFLLKAPVELYFLIRTKNKEIQQKRDLKVDVREESSALAELELSLFRISLAVPPIALASWFAIEEFCRRYKLNPLTDLIQPQYMLLIILIAGIVPVKDYLDKQTKEHSKNKKGTAASEDMTNVLRLLRTQDTKMEEMTLKIEQQAKLIEQIYKNVEGEIRLVKKELRATPSASEGLSVEADRRMMSLENRIELAMMLLRERSENPSKGLLDMLMPSQIKSVTGTGRF